MKNFNCKINSFLFQILILFCSYNTNLCLTQKQRKRILNYLLGREISYTPNLKDDDTSKPLTFFTEESQLFRSYVIATLDDNISANPNCVAYLTDIYESSIFPAVKLIRDSSHTFFRLGSYQDCKYKIYYDPNDESINSGNISYNYILFYTPPDDINFRPALFGICVPNVTDCEPTDYVNILESFNMKADIIDSSYFGGIESYILDDSTKNVGDNFYIGLIVAAFCLIIFLFGFFPGIVSFLFKCCFKKKYSKSKKIDIYKTRSLIKLEKAFDIKESIAEIYAKDIGVGYDTGISFVKGIRGIFLFFFILGNTLEAVYQYPLQQNFNQYFNTNSLSFLFFFNRCSKSVFISFSAFTMCFKILCFFDNEIERNELKDLNIKLDYVDPDVINSSIQEDENRRKRSKHKIKKRKSPGGSPNSSKSGGSPENTFNISGTKKNNLSGTTGEISSSKMNLSKSSSGDLSKMPSMGKINSVIAEIKFYNKLSFKSFLIFFFRQFYKFFLFIIVVLFYRYFYYDFIAVTTENPMWQFIKHSYIDKLIPDYLCSIIFLYFPFYMEANDEIKYDFFDIIILEISLFILFSFVLFIFYKKNFRLDIFLIVLFVIGLAIKVTVYLVIINKVNDQNTIYADYFYPSKGFTNKKYKLILNNPLYFFASISIGLFFGLVNYAIQKSAKNIKDFKDKLYLTIPIWFVNKLKRRPWIYSIIFLLMFITYFIWCGLSYKALFISDKELKEDLTAKKFFDNQSINIYFSLDVDIFVFILFLAIIPINLIGENFISSFLEHEYWNMFSRPYFSFMLLVQIVGSNILYRMNTLVNNDITTILFFTIINMISSITFGMLIYILLEVPLKKVNKFILSKKESEDDIENYNNKDENEKLTDDKIEENKGDDKDDDNDDKILFADL